MSVQDLHWQCARAMRRMHWDAQLVHGDLSAYNVLVAGGTAYLLDVSQAVLTTHPEATAYLWRDCRNMARFFADTHTDGALSALELYVVVTADPGAHATLVVHTSDPVSDSDDGNDYNNSSDDSDDDSFPQRDLLDYAQFEPFAATVRRRRAPQA
jgi:serine/threonine-protein kinase RIO1